MIDQNKSNFNKIATWVINSKTDQQEFESQLVNEMLNQIPQILELFRSQDEIDEYDDEITASLYTQTIASYKTIFIMQSLCSYHIKSKFRLQKESVSQINIENINRTMIEQMQKISQEFILKSEKQKHFYLFTEVNINISALQKQYIDCDTSTEYLNLFNKMQLKNVTHLMYNLNKYIQDQLEHIQLNIDNQFYDDMDEDEIDEIGIKYCLSQTDNEDKEKLDDVVRQWNVIINYQFTDSKIDLLLNQDLEQIQRILRQQIKIDE